MYVCPSCSEEIPDRVRKTAEECPFCHTAWPPPEEEMEPEAPPEPARPAGWGQEFKPSPASTAVAVVHEEEKKSKVGLIVVLLVLVLGGGGAGFYFGVIKGKGKAGKKGAASSGPSEEEFSAMQSWYNEAHKIIYDYLATDCTPYHNAGFQYYSRMVPVKSFVQKGKKRLEKLEFKLELQPAGKGTGSIQVFECPYKIATIHRDHPYVLEAKVIERKQVFGAVLNWADIEVKGKLTGYLKDKDGKPQTKFRSLASQTLDGFSFPGLKKAPDPGLAALGQELPFKMAAKTFTLANLVWHKTAPGKYIVGTWELRLSTDEHKNRFESWATACEGVRRARFARLSAPKGEHKSHQKMYKAARDVMRDVCDSMEKLKGSLDPWKEADATDANNTLVTAHKRWNAEVYNELVDIGKKTQNTVRAKAF